MPNKNTTKTVNTKSTKQHNKPVTKSQTNLDGTPLIKRDQHNENSHQSSFKNFFHHSKQNRPATLNQYTIRLYLMAILLIMLGVIGFAKPDALTPVTIITFVIAELLSLVIPIL